MKVCEFFGHQSAREKLSANQSETAFPKTEQSFNKNNFAVQNHEECTSDQF